LDLVYDYIAALTHLYGIVHKEKVVEIFNQQNEEKIDVAVLDNLIKENNGFFTEQYAKIFKEYFISDAIFDEDDFESELAQKEGKPYYIPEKKKLLKYSDNFYFEKNKEYRKLLNYVTKYITDGNKFMADQICDDIQLACQDESFNFNYIFNEFDRRGYVFENEEQINDIAQLVIDLANNTRLWTNNGHTPNELVQMSGRGSMLDPVLSNRVNEKGPNLKVVDGGRSKKIGRNDPCPCDSGKKYKKCCLGKI